MRLEEREETGLEVGYVEFVGRARVWEFWVILGGFLSRGSSMEGFSVVKYFFVLNGDCYRAFGFVSYLSFSSMGIIIFVIGEESGVLVWGFRYFSWYEL